MADFNAGSNQKKIATKEKMKNLSSDVQDLLRQAVEARLVAYAPYSKFLVGAALLCEDGTVFKGCNVENASFPVGVCAEKTSFTSAICAGKRKFKAIAVIAFQEKCFSAPCGSCRQFMSEFGQLTVYLSKPDLDDVFITTLNDLLPFQFKVEDYTF